MKVLWEFPEKTPKSGIPSRQIQESPDEAVKVCQKVLSLFEGLDNYAQVEKARQKLIELRDS
jgi:hypothetical protein